MMIHGIFSAMMSDSTSEWMQIRDWGIGEKTIWWILKGR
jgi:hypothetical protein